MIEFLWQTVVDTFESEHKLFVLGTWAVLETTFWGINGFLYFVYQNGWFEEYKIIPGKWPETDLTKKCLHHLLINHFITRPILLYVLFYSFKVSSKIFINIQRWGMSTTVADLPSPTTLLFQFACFIVINDTLFYWSHRLFHHPSIYKYIHKKHHEVDRLQL
jgi:sterol desaturase/sphingolipid hydroxylase (fatty acid hydroxylase superfamily)